jgi:hypothetical protein
MKKKVSVMFGNMSITLQFQLCIVMLFSYVLNLLLD